MSKQENKMSQTPEYSQSERPAIELLKKHNGELYIDSILSKFFAMFTFRA